MNNTYIVIFAIENMTLANKQSQIFLVHFWATSIIDLYIASCVTLFSSIFRRASVWIILPGHIPTHSPHDGNFYLDPSCNSVVDRCWIPRYCRAVIGWDKDCRSRVISSRECDELPWKRNIQRSTLFPLNLVTFGCVYFWSHDWTNNICD